MKKLDDWRTRIDRLDGELVEKLNERARCVIEIGKHKAQRGLKVYDPAREEQILARVVSLSRGPLDREAVRRLFERILDESRRVERLACEPDARPARRGPRSKEP
jgi:chorismate mutase